MYAVCLADFFNLDLWPSGRTPNQADLTSGLSALVSAALAGAPRVRDLLIRLYGGWHGDVPRTRVHLRPLTTQAIRRVPHSISGTRVRLELAETPVWDRSLQLLGTVRRSTPNRIPIALNQSPKCLDSTGCPLPLLEKWCNGTCPDQTCPVRLSNVASVHHQKMVDTLLTADALFLALHEKLDAVLVASDDDDLFPAMLAVSNHVPKVVVLTRRPAFPSYYRDILEQDGTTLHTW